MSQLTLIIYCQQKLKIGYNGIKPNQKVNQEIYYEKYGRLSEPKNIIHYI